MSDENKSETTPGACARQNFGSGGPWEETYGYSRTVRVGNVVYVSGCTAIDDAGTVRSHAREQTVQTLRNVEDALARAGARLSDVVRTRIYVTDIARDGDDVGRVHGAVFGAIRPAATMVEVRALIHPDMMVEIEAEAVVLDR